MDRKIKNILNDFYSNYDEENRLNRSNHNKLEFITTVEYINKYLKTKDKIIEIGAGTGRYSRYYADKGYDVHSIELVESNIEIFRKKVNPRTKITIEQGNALNLENISDNSFDITLCLGPLYHLFSEEEQMQAINEAIRVTKKDGIVFFAYITNDAVIINDLLRKNKLMDYKTKHDKKYTLDNSPDEIFSCYEIEDFERQVKSTNTKVLNIVATDGIAPTIRELIDNLNNEEFSEWTKYHLARCERRELLGYSCHILYICKKL